MIAWTLTFALSARALPKTAAERNGHVLVSDLGPRPGELDEGDELTDLDAPCGVEADRATRERRARAAAREPDHVADEAPRILARVGLGGFAFDAAVIDAHRGEDARPLVVIAPEVHLELNHGFGNQRLHAVMTGDLLRLTERLLAEGHPPLNAIENPEEIRPSLGLNLTTPAVRRAAVRRLIGVEHLGPGDLLSELFPDAIKSVAVDDPELYAHQRLIEFAIDLALSPAPVPAPRALDRLRVHLASRGDTDLIARLNLEAFFRSLLTRPVDEIEALGSVYCERRSRAMADRATGAASGAQVVLLQLGALHVHGVRARLREVGAGYLVLSP